MVFRFKEFSVEHGRSTQRVTTDSVLLGSWLEAPSGSSAILDVGTGCGLLALMCAQKCSAARIEAIDIDSNSVDECGKNFRSSPWTDRLRVYNRDFQDVSGSYDLIVSNPPYFDENTLSPSERRNRARHSRGLTIASLIGRGVGMLNPGGSIALVCPASKEREVRAEAVMGGLRGVRECRVAAVEGREPSLLMFQLYKDESESGVDNLAIKTAGGYYTVEYKELTKPFYLFLNEQH